MVRSSSGGALFVVRVCAQRGAKARSAAAREQLLAAPRLKRHTAFQHRDMPPAPFHERSRPTAVSLVAAHEYEAR